MGWFSSMCSSIGSAISSVCSSVGSAVRGFCNIVSNAVSSIGNVASTISVISKVLAVIPGMQTASAFLLTISKVAAAIAVMCKVFSPDDNIEDIGERALQAEENGITLEKCENDFNKYMEKLRNMELDPNKKHDIDECRLAGALVAEKGISLQNVGLSTKYLTPLILFKNGLVTEDKAVQWGHIAQKLGYSFADVAKFYLGDKFSVFFDDKNADKGHGGKIVNEAEKILNPNKTTVDIIKETSKEVNDIRDIIGEAENKFKEEYPEGLKE